MASAQTNAGLPRAGQAPPRGAIGLVVYRSAEPLLASRTPATVTERLHLTPMLAMDAIRRALLAEQAAR
jgi:hypothetical protein